MLEDALQIAITDLLQITQEEVVQRKPLILADMNPKAELVQKMLLTQIEQLQELKITDTVQELVERQPLLTDDLIEATRKIEVQQLPKENRKEVNPLVLIAQADQILKTVYLQEEKVHLEIIRKTDQVQHHKLRHKDKNQVLEAILEEVLKQEAIAIKEEVLKDQKTEDLN